MKIEIDSDLLGDCIEALRPYARALGDENQNRAHEIMCLCAVVCLNAGVPGYELKPQEFGDEKTT